MGVEKESSRSGPGYVGGLFQLFDWTAKSRKKLFSSKSDLPGRPKQGKRNDGNFPMTRINLIDEDETVAGSSIRESSDYSCASSVTDDDGFGARAPGVVARLMGLDSMPTSSFSEANCNTLSDTRSLKEASQQRKHFEYYHDPQIMYSGNLSNKEDCPRKLPDLKPQKMLNRPIEKFQSEILPPKSAKSIPITHHKLLSPIKSPGFIPSKTAAHIMEAAARIIEPSPQPTAKAKISTVGSSSVTLKVRDLKERLEGMGNMPLVGSSSAPMKTRDAREKVEGPKRTARLAEPSQRPAESNAAKYLKRQPMNKSWNGSVDTTPLKSLPESEELPFASNSKGKSISLAVQAKVNVQRRKSLNSSNRQGFASQNDQSEATPCQIFRSQPKVQKSLPKKHTQNGTGVLRQNNQKQNCVTDKDKSSTSAASTSHGRNTLSGNSSVRHKPTGKTVGSKTGTRKLGSDVRDSEKGVSSYSTKHIPKKKRYLDGTLHLEKNRAADNMVIDSNQDKSSPALDKHSTWAEESKKKGMDVVSFTFTAPLMRSIPGYETFGQRGQKNSPSMYNGGKRLLLDTDSMKLSSVGYNVIGGDALSNLLEQKLRELTNSVESSSRNSVKTGSASSSVSLLQDLTPTLNSGGTTPRFYDNKGRKILLADNSGSSYDSNVFSTDPAALRLKNLFQGVDEVEECSSKSNDFGKLSCCRRPSPVSILDPSFSTESSGSLDSTDCSSTEGSKQCSSVQARAVFGFSASKEFHYVDADADLSDSASSTANGITAGKHASITHGTSPVKSTNWEVVYVQKILRNVEFMFQDFALGRTCEIINPHLFNQLESHKDKPGSGNVEAKLERKLIFDCVGECLDIRCRRYAACGYRTWTKGVTTMRRRERLAEEVKRDISTWRGMGDCMVDELVDKDMSSQNGRWLDFEIDAFALGTEIEDEICNTLLDEVVTDIQFGC